jgi:hypothetical protein
MSAVVRKASIRRDTAETKIALEVNLDGTGSSEIATGVAFFDHMLTLLSRHSLVDIKVKATGDTERERMDAIMTGFEMMNEGSPEYCPAGYVYDIVSKGCVPMEMLQSSPRPRARPERGAALQRLGLSSLA